MKKSVSNRLNSILTAILIFLIGLFTVSLFANIQYPLMWQDEADTAMFGERILKFGYPKAHDGKNYINPFYLNIASMAINKRFDAYLYQGWVPFYFTAPWVHLAKSFPDLYQKTAILRIPFAISGLLSLMIFSYTILPVFGANKNKKLIFLIFFTIFGIFSISTILHMREVRYYSLAMLAVYLIFYLHFKYAIFHKINYKAYLFFSTVLLLILFNVYYPLFFILLSTFVFFAVLDVVRKLTGLSNHLLLLDKKSFLSVFHPFLLPLVSLLLSIPYIKFFEIFKLSSEYANLLRFNTNTYFKNLQQILLYFQKFEFSLVAIFSVALISILFSKKSIRIKIFRNQKFSIVSFLSIFFVIHLIFIAKSPLMFTRYFIDLIPIMIVILLLNSFIVLENIKQKKLFLIAVITLFIIDAPNKIDPFKNHIYEMMHQYRGPLDYTIPYIKANIKNPENLVIATNYEDTSYMYYLGSKVTIGYVANNLAEDTKYTPDIVSYRKIPWWGKPEIFLKLMEKGKYDMISFPVADYFYNNIPELYFQSPHLFKTKLTDDSRKKVVLFIKEDL